jgi:SOS-response transcriptional repressor LexA
MDSIIITYRDVSQHDSLDVQNTESDDNGWMEFKDKLRAARKKAKLSQPALAMLCGWESQSRISNYETGERIPVLPDLMLIAKALKISLAELADPEYLPSESNAFPDRRRRPAQRPIPVISKIPAGGPKEIVDAYHAGAGMEELIPDVEVGPYTFGLIIDGPSMEPRFVTGDKVIIDPSVNPRPGDFVAFKCNNGNGQEDGSTFKQYRPRGMNAQGMDYYELVPLNENYPTIRSDHVECEICGTMVEHRQYRRTR